jgi:hypothetical protein
MNTINEDEHMRFLLKARAKKAQPEEVKVDPLVQLEVVEGDAPKNKKKRKEEQGRITMVVPPKSSSSGGNVADAGGETVAQSPLKKKRTLNHKEKGVTSAEGEKDGTKLDTGLPETVSPVVGPYVVAETTSTTSSPWDPLFNPELFLEKMVQMTGKSARFNSTSTDELMKMSLGHELKGLLLNYALATRQKGEVAAANEKMVVVDENLAAIEKEYTTTKEKLSDEMEALKAKYEKEVEDLKKDHEEKREKAIEDHAAALKEAQEDISAKGELITVLTKDKERAVSELEALRQ